MNAQGLSFLALSLLYGLLLVLASVRLAQSGRLRWSHSRLLYGLLVIQLGLRLGALLCMAVPLWSGADALFLFLAIPSCAFVVVFWVLLWHLFSVFLHAYLDTNAKTRLLHGTHTSFQGRALAKFFLFTGGMWLATQATLFVFVLMQKVPRYAVDLEVAIVNLTVAALAVFSLVIMHVQYSGQPHRSQDWQATQIKVSQTLFIWSCGRALQGLFGLLQSSGNVALAAELARENEETLAVGLLVVALLFGEVMCSLVVLDSSFVELLVEEKVELEEEAFVTTVKLSEVKYIRFLGKKAENGFGELTVVDYRGSDTCYRRIKMHRVSGYVTDEFLREVGQLSSLEVPHCLLPVGVTIALPELGILSPMRTEGSLFSHLHEQPRRLSTAEKVQILRDVACGLHSFHAHGRCHGHLNSHNVLLDSSRRAWVSDWGFTQLKKFAGVASGYCNKTAWSSPEVLRSQGSTVTAARPSDDVYSFGVLLWESFTEQVPFPGLSLRQLQHVVARSGYRPQIPANMLPELVAILKSCWNQEPERRPELKVLEASLASL